MGLRSKMGLFKTKASTQERMRMSDAQAFLGSYKQTLSTQEASGGWPAELAAIYEPESCLQYSPSKEVYLVLDKRTGGRVVLRITSEDASEQPYAEHEILSRLNYPGVPKSYGVYKSGTRSFMAREYFEGAPLDQVIARGTMQPQHIYQIALALCSILGYIHAQNPPVIHRDIKPQNIILKPDGSVGLTDFGIARTYKEGSDSDTRYMGTLPYAPPEQYGYAQSSPQTDIYALGIVLIYLATGSPDRRDLGRRIGDTQLRALIEKCIAFDPKDRFKDVSQVAKRINSLKSRPLRLGGLVVGICLVVALAGVGVWQLMSYFEANDVFGNGHIASNAPVGARVEPEELITWNADDYAQSNNPRIGSTSWLFDYNNGGNLQANINQGGFAVTADSNNKTYVAAGDGIYELDAEGTVVAQLFEGEVYGSLNVNSGDVFFTQNINGTIYRLRLNSSDSGAVLENVDAERIYFDNGRMYYTNAVDNLKLYTVKTTGQDNRAVSDREGAHYTNIVDGVRYYSDAGDGYRIYAQSLTTGDTALIYDSPAHWLSVWNGRIYFQDEGPGRLASMRLDGTDYQILYDQPCYQIVATSHGVFAIDAIAKEVVVVDQDGSVLTVIDHTVSEFCVAGGWVFYKESLTSSTVYMVREDGSDAHELEL